MEMPITIIVTMVVCLAVGAGVVYFSQDILFHGRQNLDAYGQQTPELGKQIISLNNPDTDTITDLAIQCAKDSSGEVGREICYVVKGAGIPAATASLPATIEANGRSFTLVSTVSAGATAIFMYYNPVGRIEIES